MPRNRRVLGDVLQADADDGFWPDGRRYDIGMLDARCSGDHAHERPTQKEIAARMDEAKRENTVIQHRVNVER